jgi:acyl carrier protein
VDVRLRFTQLLAELGFDTSNISDATRLREDLNVDSTEIVELTVATENRLAISLSDSPFSELCSIGDMVQFLENVVQT